MSYPDLLLAVTLLSFSIVCLLRAKGAAPKKFPLPPRRKGWPLIGNLLDMPTEHEWKVYHQWSKDMKTDILYMNLAGTDVVVLDTLDSATELLERRSKIYSGRMRMPMACELMGWDFNLGFLDYGNEWRQSRRLMDQQLNPSSTRQFHPHLLKIARRMLNKFLDDPNSDVADTVRHMVGEIVMSIGYGLHVQANNDPYIATAKEAMFRISTASRLGTFLVDLFPVLKYVPEWVPGAEFKKKAKEWKKTTLRMVNMPYAAAKKNMACDSGKFEPSFTSVSLEKMNEGLNPDLYTEERIKGVAGIIYAAGSDTSLSTIVSCILGLLQYPEVVTKAQQELDRVVKPGYLPDFHDQESLPYVTAIVKEALRWRVVAPVGGPHRLNMHDEYKGYIIPAGSMVVANVWAILHDEKVYPDPFTFNPDRFIKDGKLNHSVLDPENACWGFGRRICPGRHLAFSSIWITIASLLTVFDIKKSVDAEGRVVDPLDEIDCGLLCLPKPYKCSLTPRSESAKSLIQFYKS